MYVHISRYPFGPNHLLLTIDIQIFYLRLFFLLHSKKIIDNHGRQFLLITNKITQQHAQQMIMDFFLYEVIFIFIQSLFMLIFSTREKHIFSSHIVHVCICILLKILGFLLNEKLLGKFTFVIFFERLFGFSLQKLCHILKAISSSTNPDFVWCMYT